MKDICDFIYMIQGIADHFTLLGKIVILPPITVVLFIVFVFFEIIIGISSFFKFMFIRRNNK